VVFNLGSRPQMGCEPFLEGSRIDILCLCTQLYYICYIRHLDRGRRVIVGCYNGWRYKKCWKPLGNIVTSPSVVCPSSQNILLVYNGSCKFSSHFEVKHGWGCEAATQTFYDRKVTQSSAESLRRACDVTMTPGSRRKPLDFYCNVLY